MRISIVFQAVACFLFCCNAVNAQEWVSKMEDPDANFYEVQESFNTYWEGREIEKGKGWKQFRRWEYFMEQRVYPHGDRTIPSRAMEAFMRDKMRGNAQQKMSSAAANWTLIGPSSSIPSGGGAGRINAVRVHPTNSSILYACAPAGGLWKSTNSGASWTTNTDQLSVIGTTDIAIDPNNPNIMYLATGDGDAGDTYSIGVLKSTDGGTTWGTTGLSWSVTQGRRISKLLIHPTDSDTLLAATTNGIIRSVNGGTTWSTITAGNFKDIEFNTGDPSIVYASGTAFYRSTNTGASFSQVATGLPTSGVARYAIGVTEADPNYVYLLAGRTSDNGFRGVYRSTNGGTSFSTMATTPNLLGWSTTGSDSGGQAWYDLAIGVSHTNKNVVFVGGVNIWKSTNGGSSWSLNGHWYGGGGVPYVHADIHDLYFLPGTSTLLVGNDGGVFRTTNSGSSWNDISDGLQIAQMYRLSTAATASGTNISGWQDNGTNRVVNGSWDEVYGGDGMECIIDPTSASIMYGSLYYGEIFKSTNGGNSFPTTIASSGGSGVDEDGAWVTPYVLDPSSNTTILIGKNQVYKSTNGGNTFSTVGSISGGSGKIIALAVAPSNGNYIYAAKSNRLWVSTNGTSFTDRTSGLPVSSASITYIAINPTNPSEAWVTFSGYSSSNKIFHTSNAGANWTSYGTGLPNLPVNCVVYQNGTNKGLYVGTDVGVYYRDAGMSSWVAYNTGLPNVVISELEIHYGAGKLRAATYGRGMWESDLFAPGSFAPVANFVANKTTGCPGTQVTFTDQSSFAPTSWNWTFTGATPASSSLQNPVVTYSTPGVYQVTLVATNANGSGTEVKSSYITITTPLALPLAEGFQGAGFPPANWSIDNPDNSSSWTKSTSTGGFGVSSSSIYIDNFNDNLEGSVDALVTAPYNISGVTGLALTFDVAYAQYNGTYSDSLEVYASTDCGTTFTMVYSKGGSVLGTAPAQTTLFTPTSGQWRTENINLTSFQGQNTILFRFVNKGGWGNRIFVDNINLGSQTAPPVAAFTANPNTICEGDQVTFSDQSTNFPSSYTWSFPGGTPGTAAVPNPVAVYNTAGTYTATLTVSNGSGSHSTNTTITVHPNPAQPFITQSGADLVSSAPTGNQWKLNGGIIPGANGQSYTPVTSGSYSVLVTNAQNCDSESSNFGYFVGIGENAAKNGLRVFPNPNEGVFSYNFETLSGGTYRVMLTDVAGRVIYNEMVAMENGSNEYAINLAVSAGIYQLTITGDSGRVTVPVTVQ